MSDILSDFSAAIRHYGLTPPARLLADGKIHRFRSGPEHGENGFYSLQSVLPGAQGRRHRLRPDRLLEARRQREMVQPRAPSHRAGPDGHPEGGPGRAEEEDAKAAGRPSRRRSGSGKNAGAGEGGQPLPGGQGDRGRSASGRIQGHAGRAYLPRRQAREPAVHRS